MQGNGSTGARQRESIWSRGVVWIPTWIPQALYGQGDAMALYFRLAISVDRDSRVTYEPGLIARDWRWQRIRLRRAERILERRRLLVIEQCGRAVRVAVLPHVIPDDAGGAA